MAANVVVAASHANSNVMTVGLFKDIARLSLPSGTSVIRTSGYSEPGRGSAQYRVEPKSRSVADETHYSTNTRNGRRVYLAEQIPNTEMFGIVHDGAPTMEVVAGETDNVAGLTSLFTYVRANGIRQIDWADGIACTSGQHAVPDFVHVSPRGSGSGCKSIYPQTSGLNQRNAPLWFGYWSLAHTGQRPSGSGGAFARKIDIYPTKANCSAADTAITLVEPTAAANFRRGGIYYIRSQASRILAADDVEYELPAHNSIRRVVNADTETGIVIFDRELGFESEAPPYLCAIQAGAADGFGDVCLSQGIRIDGGFKIYGYNGMGAGCGSYEGYFDIGGDCHHGLSFNALVHGFARYRGTWRSRALEVKFCSEASTVIVEGDNPYETAGIAIASVGEYARDIGLKVHARAPKWTGPGGAVQMQPGINCTITAKIYAPALTSTPLLVYADPLMPFSCNRCDIDVVHGSANLLVIAASDGVHTRFEARNNEFRIRGRTSELTKPGGAIILQGGIGNSIMQGSSSNHGEIIVMGKSNGNSVDGMVLGPDGAIIGTATSSNKLRNIFKLDARGRLINLR